MRSIDRPSHDRKPSHSSFKGEGGLPVARSRLFLPPLDLASLSPAWTMRTINESTEENVAAECSSALRGAEVIPPPPQPPPSCHPVLPCLSRLHLAPQTSNEYHPPPPPTAIGDPMNRNLSNSPSRSPRVSRWRDRSPSTPTAANRAFTRTGLIPRALFFGDARRAPKLETEKSFRSGESCAKDSAAGASRSHRFSDTFGDDSIDAQFGITIRRETSRICIYIELFAYIEEEEICW